MPHLAAKTLVAAHEMTLERWKKEKPEQFSRLAPPVRTDPVYRPLAPSPSEESFYRERREHLRSLPQYRLRELSEVRENHIRAHSRIAVVEDRHRVGVFQGRVSDILRGDVDWPEGVLTFAREEIPRQLHRSRYGTSSRELSNSDELIRSPIASILPRSIIGNAARIKRVDEYTLYRALDDLQTSLSERLPELLSEYALERMAADHVVIIADGAVIGNALAGYDDSTREAVALTHTRSYPFDDYGSGTPVHVACSPSDIRPISEQVSDVRNTCDEKGEK